MRVVTMRWRPWITGAYGTCTLCARSGLIAARGFDETDETNAAWACDPCLTATLDALATSVRSEAVTLREWLDAQPTRESWLMERVLGDLTPIFAEVGIALPPVRVACGWTGVGHEGCTLGVCYDTSVSASGIHELFISPAVADPLDVLCILMHELSHTVAGVPDGHGGKFGDVCAAVDLSQAGTDGKGEWPTQAYPSPDLQERLRAIVAACEPYPHARLEPPPPQTTVVQGNSGGPQKPEGVGKQGTRLLKAACPTCGYVIRVTMKWATVGLPFCGAHEEGETHRLILADGAS